jgi:hypothetical protein
MTPWTWESIRQSFSEQGFVQPAQVDNGLERADWNLAPVGNRHSGSVSAGQSAPIDDVAASLMHQLEAMRPQEAGHLGGREWPEFRHGPVGEARRCRPASAGA